MKRCHTKHAGRYSIAVSKQKLPQSFKRERRRQLGKKQDKREKKQELWAAVGEKRKRRSTKADKPYLQKLMKLKSYKSITLLQKHKT